MSAIAENVNQKKDIMLQLDWKVVDEKIGELYPEFRKGLSYTEIEQRLGGQGLDKAHIDFIIRELDKKQLEERGQGDSTGILILSGVSVMVFAFILGVFYRNGYLIFSVGMMSALFMLVKVYGQWGKQRRLRK